MKAQILQFELKPADMGKEPEDGFSSGVLLFVPTKTISEFKDVSTKKRWANLLKKPW